MQFPSITRKEYRGDGYFILEWSALTAADKYKISSSVPAFPGIYELYHMDKQKSLNLLTVAHAWLGGLRSTIRERIEPSLRADPAEQALLEDGAVYYRFSVSQTLADIEDTLWFLHTAYFPDDVRVSHSGRFKKIFVQEKAPDRIRWV